MSRWNASSLSMCPVFHAPAAWHLPTSKGCQTENSPPCSNTGDNTGNITSFMHAQRGINITSTRQEADSDTMTVLAEAASFWCRNRSREVFPQCSIQLNLLKRLSELQIIKIIFCKYFIIKSCDFRTFSVHACFHVLWDKLPAIPHKAVWNINIWIN